MRDPFPDPNMSLPSSMTGSKADVPLKKIPSANVLDPTTQSPENSRAPTIEIHTSIVNNVIPC